MQKFECCIGLESTVRMQRCCFHFTSQRNVWGGVVLISWDSIQSCIAQRKRLILFRSCRRKCIISNDVMFNVSKMYRKCIIDVSTMSQWCIENVSKMSRLSYIEKKHTSPILDPLMNTIKRWVWKYCWLQFTL